MTATESTVRHEVEVDTRIAAAYDVVMRTGGRVRLLELRLETARERAAGRPEAPRLQNEVDRITAELEVADEAYVAAQAALLEVEREYTGWSRFFLVKASNGHIHSSLHCSTCFSTTEYGWLTDVSGLSEAEAVAAHGERLCTVCFPSAPSAWTDASAYYARISREGREERVAARQAKADAKAARDAKRRETNHFGCTYVRHADGARIEHWRDYRGEVDWSIYSAKSMKAALKEKSETDSEHGHIEIIDLNTLEVVEA